MKKKITILTATRAEYGLLKPIILAMDKIDDFLVQVVVTGAHLSPEFGLTYHNIIDDGIKIEKKIEILLSSDTPIAISKSMGLAMISFGEYFEEMRPDALMVLGDRYETLAVCCAAMNARIPIIHLYGGETTQGAIDEAIRHSITKMSYLHFTSTEIYRKRVIQLGENPDRVFNVGAVGVENALSTQLMSKNELEKSIDFKLDQNYAVLTFHPVTLEEGQAELEFREVLLALDQFPDLKIIFTKANADANGRIVNQMIEEYTEKHKKCIFFESLGSRRYLSAVKYSAMVIGNSSSGLAEVPIFKVPTINIGDRQKGRLQANSVINCQPNCDSIVSAMRKTLDTNFKESIKELINPYEKRNTVALIIQILKTELLEKKINLMKEFHDVSFEIRS